MTAARSVVEPPSNRSPVRVTTSAPCYACRGFSGQISGGSLNHPAHFISLNNLRLARARCERCSARRDFCPREWKRARPRPSSKEGAADHDGDGVSDAFELANGMNRFSAADATLDADRDGNNARAEYLLGLNPATSDRFAWTTTRTGNSAVVSFPTLPQRTHRVFWSSDLLGWKHRLRRDQRRWHEQTMDR